MSVLRTQIRGVARRPARMLLTGLAVLVVSFVVYATVLAQQITVRTMLDGLSGIPAATDLVVGGQSPSGGMPQIPPAELTAPTAETVLDTMKKLDERGELVRS